MGSFFRRSAMGRAWGEEVEVDLGSLDEDEGELVGRGEGMRSGFGVESGSKPCTPKGGGDWGRDWNGCNGGGGSA